MTPISIWFKQLGSRQYLVASVFSVVVACFYCIPLTPVFLKLFVPFPALEEATVITGTVEVVGKWSSKAPARYFIVNESGRYQVYCGLPTERLSCFGFGSDKFAQGATGTVWFHPTFGVIQCDLTLHVQRAEGHPLKCTYAAEKRYFEEKFSYKDYRLNGFVVLVALSIALYQFMKFKSLRILERRHRPDIRKSTI